MLKVKNLVKKYGSLEVLKGISFEVKKGTVYGFLGENGAGKTTTMNILTGLINFNSSSISIDGEDFALNRRKLLKKIGYLPQNPVFYNYMNSYEYLNFIGTLSSMPKNEIQKRTNELLELVDLKDAAKRPIGHYSGGMKQRFGIAVSMFNKPELLILDEPTSALDPGGRMEVLELIKNLKKEGITVFLSTHILNDVERICSEVSILHKGKIIVSESLDKLEDSYIQPIYDIEFENDVSKDKFDSEFKEYSWVQKTVCTKKRASVYVNNVRSSGSEILSALSKFNEPVVSLNLRKSTLEDIFLRLVNNDGSI